MNNFHCQQRPSLPAVHYPGVPRLVRLFRLLGDLPSQASVASDTNLYEGPIVEGVKRYQLRHGLQADGRLVPNCTNKSIVS